MNFWDVQRNLSDYLGRYEFVDEKSNKFWECLKDGDSPGKFATRWGSNKQTKTKHNIKAGMSSSEAATKIAEKINKGYKMVQHNPNDVMNLRVATEEATLLDKATNQVSVPEPAAEEAPAPARRRL